MDSKSDRLARRQLGRLLLPRGSAQRARQGRHHPLRGRRSREGARPPRPSFTSDAGLRWTPDGRALTYIDTINGVSNIWSLPLDGGPPKQLTDSKTDQIFWFDFSRDGKQLALSRGTQTSDVILIRDFK